jgi:hypothetical protein
MYKMLRVSFFMLNRVAMGTCPIPTSNDLKKEKLQMLKYKYNNTSRRISDLRFNCCIPK